MATGHQRFKLPEHVTPFVPTKMAGQGPKSNFNLPSLSIAENSYWEMKSYSSTPRKYQKGRDEDASDQRTVSGETQTASSSYGEESTQLQG